MTSPLSNSDLRPAQPSPGFWLLLLYWVLGVAIALLYLQPPLPFSASLQGGAHASWIAVGLAVTLITNWAYDQISEDQGRSLDYPTLIAFPILNGICETIWFLATFKLGASLAALYTESPVWIFTAGFTLLFCYSGVIHAFFWLKLLPPHLNRDPKLKGIKRVWMLGLLLMTLLWAWLYFAFQDFWTVVGLHVLVDVAIVLSIRYSLLTRGPKLTDIRQG